MDVMNLDKPNLPSTLGSEYAGYHPIRGDYETVRDTDYLVMRIVHEDLYVNNQPWAARVKCHFLDLGI